MSLLLRLAFGISEVRSPAGGRGRSGVSGEMRVHLQRIEETFARGYNASLEESEEGRLVTRLAAVNPQLRGFAYEGAAMGLTLRATLVPWRRQALTKFCEKAAAAYIYLAHVGAGWILARHPGRIDSFIKRFDPLLRWLVVDGYGFHEGFFHPRSRLLAQAVPRRLSGYATRAFDQGLGRSLWFFHGGNWAMIVKVLEAFSSERQADLWSGVGLAAVYAGEVSAASLLALREGSGRYWPHLAQGAAFAAKARQRAEIITPYTEMACCVLMDMTCADAAELTDATLENLPADELAPAYEIWRQRIQNAFAHREVIP